MNKIPQLKSNEDDINKVIDFGQKIIDDIDLLDTKSALIEEEVNKILDNVEDNNCVLIDDIIILNQLMKKVCEFK